MFLRSLSYFLLCVMLACVGRFPGRDEPWLIRCPGPHHVTSEIRGGPWAPPPRMCRHNSSVQIVVLCLVLIWLRSGVRLCSERSGEKTLLFEFWPFKFRSLLGCFSGLGFWGPPGGCAVSTTFFFRATGLRRTDGRQAMSLFVVFDDWCFFFPSWMRTRLPPTSRRWICSTRRVPKTFCRFFLRFGFCGVLLPLGWWGSPCGVFPLVLGWVGGRFGFSAASCTLASSL